MSYTLTIHPDGTHQSMYLDDGIITRDDLADAIGGRPYVESLTEDADVVTSETAAGRGTVNTIATALAWGFGKTQLNYYGDVIITGGTDRRGHLHGLRRDQLSALVDVVSVLRQRKDAGFPVQLLSEEEQRLRRSFKIPDFAPAQGAEDDTDEDPKPKTKLVGALCLIVGLLIGGGTTAAALAGGDDEDAEVVTEEPEEGAEDEAGVTAEELNQTAEDLAQREAEIDAYEADMQDLSEREDAVDSRESEADSLESTLDSRESDVESRESDADTRESDLDKRSEDLDDREDELDERESEMNEQDSPAPEEPEDSEGSE